MTLLWFVTGAALVVALVALVHARRNAKNLEQLSLQYWELKYQHGELRARLQQPTGESPPLQTTPTAPRLDSFVPLSSLRR
jgi:hypothetical protein